MVEIAPFVLRAPGLGFQFLDGPSNRRLGPRRLRNGMREPECLRATESLQGLGDDRHDGRVRRTAVGEVMESGEAHVDVGPGTLRVQSPYLAAKKNLQRIAH